MDKIASLVELKQALGLVPVGGKLEFEAVSGLVRLDCHRHLLGYSVARHRKTSCGSEAPLKLTAKVAIFANGIKDLLCRHGGLSFDRGLIAWRAT